ncbi:MAG: 4'-phosphopantetheinyl transferase family protein [Candidatus Binatia bacterium]
MIGNDVVDLADPETMPSATHPRFDERVFAAEELASLARSRAGTRLRWMLWAAKESAFKAAKKLDPATIFAPRRMIVRLACDGSGSVSVGERAFSLRVLLDGEVCHAVACAAVPAGALIVSGLRRLGPCDLTGTAPIDPRRAVRRLAIGALAPWLGVKVRDLTFIRDGRVPRLRWRGRLAPVDVSLSHHGRFVAFAGALDPRGPSER